MNTAFDFSGLLVLPFWLLMIFLPRWRWTQRIVGSTLIVVPIALLYVVLLIANADLSGEFGSELLPPQLESVQSLLSTAVGATIAWVHFGAFDLFVGRWVYLDSRETGLSAWVVSPLLLAVFAFGPLGFLLYLAARWALRRRRVHANS